MLHRPRASRLASLVFLTAVLMTAGVARAQEAAPPAAPPPAAPPPAAAPVVSATGFGAPGTWVFTFETADNGYGFAFFHKSSGDGGSVVVLNPGVDYFLAPNISLGGNLFFSHNSAGQGSTGIGAGVRAGYNLNIADNIGFWPSARFFLIHNSANGAPSNTDESLGIFAPFIWHLTTHFFLGGGPDLNHQLSNGGGTEFGLDFILGGWL